MVCFFRLLFNCCLSGVHNCDDRSYLHFLIRSPSIIQTTYIHSHLKLFCLIGKWSISRHSKKLTPCTGQILPTCAVLQDVSAPAQCWRARFGDKDQGESAVLNWPLESVFIGQRYFVATTRVVFVKYFATNSGLYHSSPQKTDSIASGFTI